jgi:hypothetical protein
MFINGKFYPLFYFDKDEGAGSAASETDATTQDKATTDAAKGNDGKDFDPVRAQALIDKLRDSEKEKEKAIKLLKRQIKQLTADDDDPGDKATKSADKKDDKSTADESDLAKQIAALTKRLDEAEAGRVKAELNTTRAQIAAKYNIPAKLAARLQGETPEQIEADAKEIAAALPAAPGKRGALGNGADGKPENRVQKLKSIISGQGVKPFDVDLQREMGGFVGAAGSESDLRD